MLRTVVICAGLAIGLTACATQTAPRSMADSVTRTQRPPGCVANTATRLPVKEDDCSGFGHSYTQGELQRTGAATTGEALRLLDPALTIRGH